jgi:hypothetical protein
MRVPVCAPIRLVILMALNVCSQTADAVAARRAANAEQQLLAIEKKYLEARVRNDKATRGEILADDFVATDAEGRTGDKESTISNANVIPGGAKLISQDIDDVRIRVFGKSGVITGRQLIKTEAGER